MLISGLKAITVLYISLLSPSDSADGVHAMLSSQSDQVLKMTTGYRTNQWIGRGSKIGWEPGETYYSVFYGRRLWGWKWTLSARHSKQRGRLAYSNASEFKALIRPQQNRLQAAVHIQSNRLNLISGGWWRTATETEFEGGLFFGWRPMRTLFGGIEYSRLQPLANHMELYYLQEGGSIKWLAPLSSWSYAIHFMPLEGWTVVSTLSRAHFLPNEAEFREQSVGTYSAAIEGLVRNHTFRAEKSARPNLSWAVEYRQILVDARVLGYDGAFRFAHFGQANFNANIWSVQMRYNHYRLDVQRGVAEGNLAGTVEAWPFVSGLAKFLGDRRHLVSSGVATWYFVNLSDEFTIGRRLFLQAAVRYVHLRPDLRYVSWRPVIFGMGIDDLQSGRWEIRRANLVQAVLSPRLQTRRWTLHLNFSQWIPLSISRYNSQPNNSESSNVGDIVVQNSKENRSNRGFSFSAGLSFSL